MASIKKSLGKIGDPEMLTMVPGCVYITASQANVPANYKPLKAKK